MDRNINDRISSMERNINDRFDAMGDRFDAVGERMSSMEQNTNDRFQAVNQNLTEMRTDIRMLTRAMLGFYVFIIAAVGLGFTLYKLFPNPTP